MNSIGFGANLYRLRKQKGLTQAELSEKLNLTRSAIGMYESGKMCPPVDKLQVFADFFGVDMNTLITGHAATLTDTELPPKPLRVTIPILCEIAAGQPIGCDDNVIGHEEISFEMAQRGQCFALRVKGDSMLPHISDGDIVIFRATPYVNSGAVAIVKVNGDSATCKKFYLKDDGVLLKAYNPDIYPDKFYSSKEVMELPVTVVGEVIEVRKRALP